MSWNVQNYLKNKTWTEFDFFTSGGADGWRTETINNVLAGKMFKLEEVRLHLSVVHASVEDFVIRVSADSLVGGANYASQDSHFNFVFLSQAMSGVNEILYRPESPLRIQSDDHLVFSLYIESATNMYGIQVIGWAIASG